MTNAISHGKSPSDDLNVRTKSPSLELNTSLVREAARQGRTDCVERSLLCSTGVALHPGRWMYRKNSLSYHHVSSPAGAAPIRTVESAQSLILLTEIWQDDFQHCYVGGRYRKSPYVRETSIDMIMRYRSRSVLLQECCS